MAEWIAGSDGQLVCPCSSTGGQAASGTCAARNWPTRTKSPGLAAPRTTRTVAPLPPGTFSTRADWLAVSRIAPPSPPAPLPEGEGRLSLAARSSTSPAKTYDGVPLLVDLDAELRAQVGHDGGGSADGKQWIVDSG